MRHGSARLTLSFALVAACLAVSAWLTPVTARQGRAGEPVTRPVISEDVSPIEPIAPVALDGHRGQGFLRKPPGAGPFPAIILIHGGMVIRPPDVLKEYVLAAPQPSRFLAAGYVVAAITYRSRDDDPQSKVSLDDSLAATNLVRQLSYVDSKSLVIYGCSGGGDLALEIAATTDLAAIAPEEPASVLFTGVFNRDIPKAGDRYVPLDSEPISADPTRYYTRAFQQLTREKIGRIHTPILIVQGDQHFINRFNAHVFIPELRAAGKTLEVITYAGEPHCFGFRGSGPQTPRPAVALKVFEAAETFFRRHLSTKPTPLSPTLVTHVPLMPE